MLFVGTFPNDWLFSPRSGIDEAKGNPGNWFWSAFSPPFGASLCLFMYNVQNLPSSSLLTTLENYFLENIPLGKHGRHSVYFHVKSDN